jgi:hypothetical protein
VGRSGGQGRDRPRRLSQRVVRIQADEGMKPAVHPFDLVQAA